MKIKNFKNVIITNVIILILLGGRVALANTNEKKLNLDKENITVEMALEEIDKITNGGKELTEEEYNEIIEYISSVLPTLKDGSDNSNDMVSVKQEYLELMLENQMENVEMIKQANEDVEEFNTWLNTLEVQSPISQDELNNILND